MLARYLQRNLPFAWSEAARERANVSWRRSWQALSLGVHNLKTHRDHPTRALSKATGAQIQSVAVSEAAVFDHNI